jgi:glycosyltransferase involved in cell wall biosynthesis
MKEKEYISLVLYTYNHEVIISETLGVMFRFLSLNFEQFEIVVVNDASSDNTKQRVIDFVDINNTSRITLINLSFRHGLETGICVGVDFSVGDFIVELDSPYLLFNENILLELYAKSCEGFDIVSLKLKGSRNVSSKLFYHLLNSFSSGRIEYGTEICCILTRRAVNEISKIKDKTKYRKILHNYSGFAKKGIEIEINGTIRNSSNLTEKLRLASDILFSFTNIGYKINMYILIFFLLMSCFMACYSIYQYLFNEKVVDGWTTIMLFLSFSFSGIFIVLGVLNKYFSILMREIRTTPEYTIESIIKN